MGAKKSGEFPAFVIYSYFKDSAFTAVKRDAMLQTMFEKGISSSSTVFYPFYIHFLSKKAYKGKGLDLGAEPTLIKLC